MIKQQHDLKIAIRWHMGGFDSAAKGGDYGKRCVGEERFNNHPCLRPGQINDVVLLFEVLRDVILIQNLKNTLFHTCLQ